MSRTLVRRALACPDSLGSRTVTQMSSDLDGQPPVPSLASAAAGQEFEADIDARVTKARIDAAVLAAACAVTRHHADHMAAFWSSRLPPPDL